MGSQPSRQPKLSADHGSQNKSKKAFRLPRADFIALQASLDSLPFSLTEDQFSLLAKAVEVFTVEKGSLIIKEGSSAKGIFIVAEGSCEVYDANEESPVRVVQSGDFFGEISTVFSEPCTATVKASHQVGCKMLVLRADIFSTILQRYDVSSISKFQWYISRKYLDLNRSFGPNEISYELALDCLRKAPLFYEWSDESLKCIVSTYYPCPFDLYPSNVVLYTEGECNRDAYLMVYGAIEFRCGISDNVVDTLVLPSGPKGLWFGDEPLFCESVRRNQVATKTPCLIMTISAYNLECLVSDFPVESSKLMTISSKWRVAVQTRDKYLYKKSRGELDLEPIRLALRQTEVFRQAPAEFLYFTALDTVMKHFDEEEVVLSGEGCEDIVVVILSGRLSLRRGKEEIKNYIQGDVFYQTQKPDNKNPIHLICQEEAIVGFIPKTTIEDNQDTFTGTALIWKDVNSS